MPVKLYFKLCMLQSLHHERLQVILVGDIGSSREDNPINQEMFYSLSLKETKEVFLLDIHCEGRRDCNSCLRIRCHFFPSNRWLKMTCWLRSMEDKILANSFNMLTSSNEPIDIRQTKTVFEFIAGFHSFTQSSPNNPGI